MVPVVDVAWLRAHPEAVVADVRYYLDGRSGRDAYDGGHIPGAIFVDLHAALSDPPSPDRGRHPFPSPEAFAEALGALGIRDADPVVAYDDMGGTMAARLVWMLRAIGAPAALLDGGIPAWDGPLERDPVARPPVTRTPRPWPADRLADIDDVARVHAPLLDARAGARFRGEHEPIDPVAGHVPAAVNAPLTGNTDESGRFLPDQDLRSRFVALGVTDGGPVAAYCGSGVTATQTLLALRLAGFPDAALYPGSWSGWITDPSRPVATSGG
jgi:thiosulfate/3-mercaptopyruvate sulfurtransferase